MDYGVCGSSRLEDEDRQEDLSIHSLVCLDLFVKLSIVDMLKCTTHVLCLDFIFMNSLDQNKFKWFYVY